MRKIKEKEWNHQSSIKKIKNHQRKRRDRGNGYNATITGKHRFENNKKWPLQKMGNHKCHQDTN